MNFLKEADGSRIVQKFQSKFKVFLFSEFFKQMALAIAFLNKICFEIRYSIDMSKKIILMILLFS